MTKENKRIQQPFTNTLTWILSEIQDNQDDCISIVCKDRKEFKSSGLLLAAVSPFVSGLMKSVPDYQESVLILPDTDVSCIKSIFDRVYSFISNDESSENSSWAKDPIATLIFPKSSLETSSLIKIENDFENCEDYEIFADNMEEADLHFDSNSNLPNNAKVFIRESKIELDGDVKSEILEKKINKGKLKKQRLKLKEKNPGRKSGWIKKEIKNEEYEVDSEDTNDNKVMNKPKSKRKKTRKTKPKKIKTGSDDSDYDNNSDNEDDKNSRLEFATPDELPKDEKFIECYEKMKTFLEDESTDTDPVMYWRQLNGLDVKHMYNKVFDLIVCPLCLHKPKEMKTLFTHLQSHKIRTLKFPCCPVNYTEAKEMISQSEDVKATKPWVYDFRIKKKHVMLEHWKWIECEFCQNLIDPEKIAKHKARHHGVKFNKQCEMCGEIFTVEEKYKQHIYCHRADNFNCECGVWFKNNKHKAHHMQSEHLKELICCEECYFMCENLSELQEHCNTSHKKTKKKWISPKVVCDICGTDVDQHYLKIHLAIKHDIKSNSIKMVQCHLCSEQIISTSMKRHLRTTHKNYEKCKICGKEYSHMKLHVLTVHKPHLLPHKCADCDKGFMSKLSLDKHIMNVHLKLRPYKCRYGCEFAYNDASNRSAHEKKKHGGLYQAGSCTEIKEDCES